jgi:tetratricopeptide (TPR) repeat protein
MTPASMKYNPAFLGDDALIDSFVARKSEFERILEVIRENAAESNQHLLIIGARGLGKTTLVLRSAAEIRTEPGLAAKWHPIVFGEETYQANSPGEFWLEALFHLGEQTGDDRWKTAYEELRRETDEDRLRGRVLAQLLDFADEHGKRLVLVVENLNMLVGDQLSGDDAWVLRHTLMNEPRIMLLGTATSRFREVEEYNQALYELFRIIDLEPLEEEEAQALWMATTGQRTTPGQIRPLQILTGGNPRLIRILSEFAAKTSFRSLMDDLTRLVDEHTEYFKHHLDNLPAQERKVFVALADLWDPSTARGVAEAARLDVNTTSALLKRLVDRGAVTVAYKRGRAQYYQVAERMYNIYHLMRRRGPAASRVHAVVRFMVSLYRDEELVRTTQSLVEEARQLTQEERREHFLAYEAILHHARQSRLAKRLVEATRYAFDAMPDVPDSLKLLIDLSLSPDLHARADLKVKSEALLGMNVVDVEDPAILLRFAIALSEHPDQLEDAEAAFRKSLQRDPDNAEAWLQFGAFLSAQINNYGRALEAMERQRCEEALVCLDHALKANADEAYAWVLKSHVYARLDRWEDSLESINQTLVLTPDSNTAWLIRAYLLKELGTFDEALAAVERSLALDSEDSEAWCVKGDVLHEQERYEEALIAFNRALTIDPASGDGLWGRGLVNRALQRFDEAESDLRQAMHTEEHNSLVAKSLVELLLNDLERPSDAVLVVRENLGKLDDVALNSIAWEFLTRGRNTDWEEAESWSRRVVEGNPQSGFFRHTLASLLGAQGKWEDALEHARTFLSDRDLLTEELDGVIAFFIDAVAAGRGGEVCEVIQISGATEALEPLIVAIQRIAGVQVDVAREILEIAKDVEQLIEARQQELSAN